MPSSWKVTFTDTDACDLVGKNLNIVWHCVRLNMSGTWRIVAVSIRGVREALPTSIPLLDGALAEIKSEEARRGTT